MFVSKPLRLTSEDHPVLFVTDLIHQQETHTDNNITKLEPAKQVMGSYFIRLKYIKITQRHGVT